MVRLLDKNNELIKDSASFEDEHRELFIQDPSLM